MWMLQFVYKLFREEEINEWENHDVMTVFWQAIAFCILIGMLLEESCLMKADAVWVTGWNQLSYHILFVIIIAILSLLIHKSLQPSVFTIMYLSGFFSFCNHLLLLGDIVTECLLLFQLAILICS